MASIESPSSSLSASRQQAPTASFRAGAARGGGSDPSCHTLLILRDLYPSPSVVLAFLESRLKAISEDAYVAAVSSNNVVDPKPARFAKDRYVLDSASVTRDAHDGRDMLVECRLPPHHQEGVSVRFEILYRPLTGPAKRAPTRDEWSRCVAAFGASMPDALGEGGGGGGDPTQSAQAQAQRQSEEASSASAAAGSTSGRRGQEEEEEPRRQTMTADEAVKGQEDADAGEEEEDLVAATPHLRLFQVYSAGVGHLEGSRYWRQLNRERSKRSEHVRDTKGEMGAAGGERNGDAANKQEEQVWASAAGIHVVPIAEHGEFFYRRARFLGRGGRSWLSKQGENKAWRPAQEVLVDLGAWACCGAPPDKRARLGEEERRPKTVEGGGRNPCLFRVAASPRSSGIASSEARGGDRWQGQGSIPIATHATAASKRKRMAQDKGRDMAFLARGALRE